MTTPLQCRYCQKNCKCFNLLANSELLKLLKVCSCKEGIHISCLQKEVKSKLQTPIENDFNCYKFVVKDFHCPKCLQTYERKNHLIVLIKSFLFNQSNTEPYFTSFTPK